MVFFDLFDELLAKCLFTLADTIEGFVEIIPNAFQHATDFRVHGIDSLHEGEGTFNTSTPIADFDTNDSSLEHGGNTLNFEIPNISTDFSFSRLLSGQRFATTR